MSCGQATRRQAARRVLVHGWFDGAEHQSNALDDLNEGPSSPFSAPAIVVTRPSRSLTVSCSRPADRALARYSTCRVPARARELVWMHLISTPITFRSLASALSDTSPQQPASEPVHPLTFLAPRLPTSPPATHVPLPIPNAPQRGPLSRRRRLKPRTWSERRQRSRRSLQAVRQRCAARTCVS